MLRQLMDFAGSLVQPVGRILNVTDLELNPRTGQMSRIRPTASPPPETRSAPSATATARSKGQRTPQPAAEAEELYPLGGFVRRGNNQPLRGATVAVFALEGEDEAIVPLDLTVSSKTEGNFKVHIPQRYERVLLQFSYPGLETLEERLTQKEAKAVDGVRVSLKKLNGD